MHWNGSQNAIETERIEKLGGGVQVRNKKGIHATPMNSGNDYSCLPISPAPFVMMKMLLVGLAWQWYGWTDPAGRPIPSMGSYRINGNLAVARTIGDRDQVVFLCGLCFSV